jgi:transcription initiation factor IIE alpha subunit
MNAQEHDHSKMRKDTSEMKMDHSKMEMKTMYTCPMHSDVKSDKLGKCPKCGMELIENKMEMLPV